MSGLCIQPVHRGSWWAAAGVVKRLTNAPRIHHQLHHVPPSTRREHADAPQALYSDWRSHPPHPRICTPLLCIMATHSGRPHHTSLHSPFKSDKYPSKKPSTSRKTVQIMQLRKIWKPFLSLLLRCCAPCRHACVSDVLHGRQQRRSPPQSDLTFLTPVSYLSCNLTTHLPFPSLPACRLDIAIGQHHGCALHIIAQRHSAHDITPPASRRELSRGRAAVH